MILSRNLRNFFLFCSILSVSLLFVACSKKDTGVFPQSITQTSGNLLLPENLQQYDFENRPKANIAPNPVGMNLICESKMLCYSYPQMASISYLFDGATQTQFIWRHSYPLLIEWPQPMLIDRLFLKTDESSITTLELYRMENYRWIPITAFSRSNSDGIDIVFSSSIETSKFVIIPFIGLNASISVSEMEIYGPIFGEFTITSPTNNSVFNLDESISFSGYGPASDVVWFSNIDGEFGTGNSFNTSGLSIGTHKIAFGLPGQIIARPVTGSIRSEETGNFKPGIITIKVGDDIDEIKVRIGNNEIPSAQILELSSLGALTTFEAIGYNSNGNEVGPVAVKWELSEGDVGADQPIRNGILTELNSNIGKIGVLSYNNATSSVVLDSKTVNFISFLSGTIKLTASLPNGVSKTIGIRLKQPTVYIALKYVEGIQPSGTVTSVSSLWVQKAQEVWGQENILTVKEYSPLTSTNNRVFESLPFDVSSETLFERLVPKQIPSFLNPLVNDVVADDHFRISFEEHVVTRQTNELFKKRVDGKIINIFIADDIYDSKWQECNTENPILLNTVWGAATISSNRYRNSISLVRINDMAESGICMGHPKDNNLDDFPIDQRCFLAHEIGHVLLNSGDATDDHVRSNDWSVGIWQNVMHEYSPGGSIMASQIREIYDYNKIKKSSSFFIMEE